MNKIESTAAYMSEKPKQYDNHCAHHNIFRWPGDRFESEGINVCGCEGVGGSVILCKSVRMRRRRLVWVFVYNV